MTRLVGTKSFVLIMEVFSIVSLILEFVRRGSTVCTSYSYSVVTSIMFTAADPGFIKGGAPVYGVGICVPQKLIFLQDKIFCKV